MGTIASVLQWTCTNCNLINPTECLKCLQCGNIRHILLESAESSFCSGGEKDNETSKCDSFKRTKHKTLPGYVEISSNG